MKIKDSNRALDGIWAGTLPPALDADECLKLLLAYKSESGDKKEKEELREKIIEGNLCYVVWFVKNYGQQFIACKSSVYPQKEDLLQEGVVALVKSVDKFDPLNHSNKFSSYLFNALYNTFGMIRRGGKNSKLDLSLDEPLNLPKDDEGLCILDMLTDDPFVADHIDTALDYKFIMKDVLSILPKWKANIFIDAHIRNLRRDLMSEKYGVTRYYCSKLIRRIDNQVKDYYLYGISPVDRALAGLDVNEFAQERMRKNLKFIQKYGRGVLKQVIALTPPNNAKVLSVGVQNYFGQGIDLIAKNSKQTRVLTNSCLADFDEKFDEYAQTAIVKNPYYVNLSEEMLTKIAKNEKFLYKYGGRAFLQKYFAPTLEERENRVFQEAVSNYSGETSSMFVESLQMSPSEFRESYSLVIEKLTTSDFSPFLEMKVTTRKKSEKRKADGNLPRHKTEKICEKLGK